METGNARRPILCRSHRPPPHRREPFPCTIQRALWRSPHRHPRQPLNGRLPLKPSALMRRQHPRQTHPGRDCQSPRMHLRLELDCRQQPQPHLQLSLQQLYLQKEALSYRIHLLSHRPPHCQECLRHHLRRHRRRRACQEHVARPHLHHRQECLVAQARAGQESGRRLRLPCAGCTGTRSLRRPRRPVAQQRGMWCGSASRARCSRGGMRVES